MMKKQFLIVVGLVVSFGVFAQDEEKTLHYDIHAGIGVAYLEQTHAGQKVNTGLKTGFTMGGALDIRLSKRWFLQPELNFESIGGGKDKTILQNMPLQGYNAYYFKYFTIPILIKFKIPATGIGIYAGPQYGKKLSAKLDYGQYGQTTLEDADGLQKMDWSGIFGAEYYRPLSKSISVGLSARYQYGFYNISDYPNNDFNMKNRAFLLTAGCRF